MELSKLEKLLDKYFEGRTTLSEEKELKLYFNRENVPSHLEKHKDLFQFFAKESQLTTTSQVKLKTNKTSWYTWVGVAVSITLIVGFFTKNMSIANDNEQVYGTYDDPEIALQKTKEALNMVARLMNQGKKDLVYLNEFDMAKKDLRYLSEFQNTKNKLIK